MPTAAAVVIGDEILNGQVRDENSARLIEALRAVGVRLQRIVTIGDDIADIAEAVLQCATRYDYVFTSGGLGPTHDDRTVEAIARAFGTNVVRAPELVSVIERHMGSHVNDAALKMAEVPEGAQLLDGGPYPIVCYRNVFILPGVPEIFAAKLGALLPQFEGELPMVQGIYLSLDESLIAAQLNQVVAEFGDVKLGSYPRLGQPDYKVLITVESVQCPRVSAVVARLLELLPPSAVVRVDTLCAPSDAERFEPE